MYACVVQQRCFRRSVQAAARISSEFQYRYDCNVIPIYSGVFMFLFFVFGVHWRTVCCPFETSLCWYTSHVPGTASIIYIYIVSLYRKVWMVRTWRRRIRIITRATRTTPAATPAAITTHHRIMCHRPIFIDVVLHIHQQHHHHHQHRVIMIQPSSPLHRVVPLPPPVPPRPMVLLVVEMVP